MTLLEKLDRLPPFLCRLLARCQSGPVVRGMTTDEIARVSGLSKSYVSDLSYKTTWRGVPPETHDAFKLACGVHPLHSTIANKYLRNGSMQHTSSGDIAQQRMYTRLLELYAKFTAGQL